MTSISKVRRAWSGEKWFPGFLLWSFCCIALAIPGLASGASLTVSKQGTGSGTVASAPTGIACGTTCRASFGRNTSITLTATAASGSTFSGWSGACTGSAVTAKLTMKTRNLSCTATFAKVAVTPQVSLAILRAGTGSGSVASSPAGITCGSACTMTVSQGATINLVATPAAGSLFAGWSNDCSGATATLAVAVNANATCIATFNAAPVSLTVSRAGSGGGSVVSTPAGINCGSACTLSALPGSVVNLMATANSGSIFAGWSGSCAGTSTSASLTLTGNAACVATFNLIPVVPQVSLTISRAGTGSGSVTSLPVGISCGTACTMTVTQGATVNLTATPGAGAVFAGWSNDCSGASATLAVAVNASATCIATFTLIPVTSGTANLSWDAVASADVAGYRVYFGTAPGVYFQSLGLGLDAGTLTAAALGGFTSGVRYYFAITAYDAFNNESTFSNEVFKDMP